MLFIFGILVVFHAVDGFNGPWPLVAHTASLVSLTGNQLLVPFRIIGLLVLILKTIAFIPSSDRT